MEKKLWVILSEINAIESVEEPQPVNPILKEAKGEFILAAYNFSQIILQYYNLQRVYKISNFYNLILSSKFPLWHGRMLQFILKNPQVGFRITLKHRLERSYDAVYIDSKAHWEKIYHINEFLHLIRLKLEYKIAG